MSIYATLWEIKVPKSHVFDDEWICVYAQAVPAHIGHPSIYTEGDIYKDFLPPVVEYDPDNCEGDFVERAVVILAEGRDKKVGQQYVDPLLVLTGAEYRAMHFRELMDLITYTLPWDQAAFGMSTGKGGETKMTRLENCPEILQREKLLAEKLARLSCYAAKVKGNP